MMRIRLLTIATRRMVVHILEAKDSDTKWSLLYDSTYVLFKKLGEWLPLWFNVGNSGKQSLLGANNGLFPYLGACST